MLRLEIVGCELGDSRAARMHLLGTQSGPPEPKTARNETWRSRVTWQVGLSRQLRVSSARPICSQRLKSEAGSAVSTTGVPKGNSAGAQRVVGRVGGGAIAAGSGGGVALQS